jgi:hypothetical protein
MAINHYRDYCKTEYNLVKNVLTCDNPFSLHSPKEVKDNALQRLLGACYLAQLMGASYQEVEETYYFYKEKIEKICETP